MLKELVGNKKIRSVFLAIPLALSGCDALSSVTSNATTCYNYDGVAAPLKQKQNTALSSTCVAAKHAGDTDYSVWDVPQKGLFFTARTTDGKISDYGYLTEKNSIVTITDKQGKAVEIEIAPAQESPSTPTTAQ